MLVRVWLCSIALWGAAICAPWSAHSLEFSESEIADLLGGRTVLRPMENALKDGFYGGMGWAIVNAPPQVIWDALHDWDAYAVHFPHTISTVEISRKGNRSLIRQELGYKILRVVYHVSIIFDDDNKTLSFDLYKNLPHDIEAARGYWRLFPQKDGSTLVGYAAAVRVPMGIVSFIGPAVERRLMQQLLGLPGFLKKWVEGAGGDRYRKSQPVPPSGPPSGGESSPETPIGVSR